MSKNPETSVKVSRIPVVKYPEQHKEIQKRDLGRKVSNGLVVVMYRDDLQGSMSVFVCLSFSLSLSLSLYYLSLYKFTGCPSILVFSIVSTIIINYQ
jgi:hypothetical protein